MTCRLRSAISHHIRRRTEFALPESSAEDYYGRRAGVVIVSAECPARNRISLQRGKEICRDHVAAQSFSLAGAGQVVILVAVHGERCKTLVFTLPIEEIQIGGRRSVNSWSLSIDSDKLVSMRVRKRVEQYPMHHCKQRGVGTDAERKGENSNGSKGGRFQQASQRIAHVLHECRHRKRSSQQVCYRKCIRRAGEARLGVTNSSLVATLLVGALLFQFGVQLHVSRSQLHFSFP